jgi:AcrR family transcriptional regulator
MSRRAEQRAETRSRLLSAAAELFAERGFAAASVEQIAARAGYTIGALYDHFGGKEGLFLALADEEWAVGLAEIEGEATSPGSGPGEYGPYFDNLTQRDRDWWLLSYEFWAYAVRNPEVAEKLAAQWAASRQAVARIIAARFAAEDETLPVPAEDLAAVIGALMEGFMLQQLVDPGTPRGEVFAQALTWLFAGLPRATSSAGGQRKERRR